MGLLKRSSINPIFSSTIFLLLVFLFYFLKIFPVLIFQHSYCIFLNYQHIITIFFNFKSYFLFFEYVYSILFLFWGCWIFFYLSEGINNGFFVKSSSVFVPFCFEFYEDFPQNLIILDWRLREPLRGGDWELVKSTF